MNHAILEAVQRSGEALDAGATLKEEGTMSNDEPTFTYDASKPLTEEQKRVLAEVQRNPPPITMLDGATPIRNRDDLQRALASEAKAHQWEHKQPAQVHVPFQGLHIRADSAKLRTFTREEIDDILRLTDAQTSWIGNEDRRAGAVDVVCALRKFFREKE